METIRPSQPWAAESNNSDGIPAATSPGIHSSPRDPQDAISAFRMIDVGAKVATRRVAIAQGAISMARVAFIALRDGTNPKGNVLALAEVAGIMAGKRCADTIPLCHPLALDYVRLSFSLCEENSTVTVYSEVGTSAKTGVEMEALAAVNGALLTIYDLCKAVDPVLTITGIRLNRKEGGKSGVWIHPDLNAGAPK